MQTKYGQMQWPLLPQHAALLEASKISPEVARARGYRSVTTDAELAGFGFAQWQRNVPTLVVPIWDVNGQCVLYQSRPDTPRTNSEGKAIKYETVAGARMCLDVPPPMRGQLDDPRVPLYITEGARKADAAASAGLCCIDVLGVWSWRGTNEKGGKTALSCWESVALNSREVFIVFDSDVAVKPAVADAMARLKAFLESRNARVKIIYLPDGPGGTKVGLDNFLAAGHSTKELLSYATPDLREAPAVWTPPTPFRVHNVPAFPTDVLSPWLRDFVVAEATATQTPPDLAGMLGLAVCATTTAGKLVVEVSPQWREPLNLFVVVVQDPGTRKSSVVSHLTAPIVAFEAERLKEEEPGITEAQIRRHIAEQALEKVQRKAASADDPAERKKLEEEAVALACEVNMIRIPVAPRLLADDCSPEKLTSLMHDQGGRIAVLSPEGDVFDLMSGRYSANGTPNLGVYLKGHAGDAIRVDRIGRPSEVVPAPALTLGLAVQESVLQGLAARPGFRGLGMLGRFLYALPPNLLGSRDTDPPSVQPVTWEAYVANVTSLLNLPFDRDADKKLRPYALRLDDRARVVLRAFQRWVEPQLGDGGDLAHMTDWAGKLVGAVVRVAGLLHAADHTRRGRPWEIPITAETLGRAICVGMYALEHAKAAYAETGADPAVADARHVLGWIERVGVETFTKREAFQGTKGRFKRVAALEPALHVLVEHGYIRERGSVSRQGPGRPASPGFDVNPLLFEQRHSENTGNSARADSPEHGTPPADRTETDSGKSEEGEGRSSFRGPLRQERRRRHG